MKIAMVSEHANPLAVLGGADAGGQNVHVGALADELVRQGHQVIVHTRRDDTRSPRKVVTPGGAVVDHVDAGPPAPLAKDRLLPHMATFADELRGQWELDPPDVVHAHFWMSGWASVRAACPLGLPVVQTFHALGSVKRRHQGAADTSPPERLEIEKDLLCRVAQVIATCADEADELIALGARPSRISVVPCGVDLARFAPRNPPPAARSGAPRFLVIGRLVERKGIGDVIAALAEVPAAQLIVAGGPPRPELERDYDVARLRRQAERHGVVDRVTFLGQVRRGDVPSLIAGADVVVTTPYYEPFGMVALEAMACGVPVVASRVGGLAETVVHDVTGLHVPPHDATSVGAALRRLAGDPALRTRLGRAGVERARRLYGWPTVASATAAVYAEVIDRLPMAPAIASRAASPAPSGVS